MSLLCIQHACTWHYQTLSCMWLWKWFVFGLVECGLCDRCTSCVAYRRECELLSPYWSFYSLICVYSMVGSHLFEHAGTKDIRITEMLDKWNSTVCVEYFPFNAQQNILNIWEVWISQDSDNWIFKVVKGVVNNGNVCSTYPWTMLGGCWGGGEWFTSGMNIWNFAWWWHLVQFRK